MKSLDITLIVIVLTEFLALNLTAMFCPGVLSRRTSKTTNGVGLFGPITSRCQTIIETFNIEVQLTGILPSKNLLACV